MPRPAAKRLRIALRTSIQNNAAVYGYSVMITCCLMVVQIVAGPASLGRVFLFVAGAVTAFASVEAAVSSLFRRREREEPAEVVVLGSAIGFVSVAGGVGAGVLVGQLARSWVGWLLGPYVATVVYLLIVSVELALAAAAADARSTEGSS